MDSQKKEAPRGNLLPCIEAVGDEHRDSRAAMAALQAHIHAHPTAAPFVAPHDGKHSATAARALLRHLRKDENPQQWYRSAGAF